MEMLRTSDALLGNKLTHPWNKITIDVADKYFVNVSYGRMVSVALT